jgi:hypothetical protein
MSLTSLVAALPVAALQNDGSMHVRTAMYRETYHRKHPLPLWLQLCQLQHL